MSSFRFEYEKMFDENKMHCHGNTQQLFILHDLFIIWAKFIELGFLVGDLCRRIYQQNNRSLLRIAEMCEVRLRVQDGHLTYLEIYRFCQIINLAIELGLIEPEIQMIIYYEFMIFVYQV